MVLFLGLILGLFTIVKVVLVFWISFYVYETREKNTLNCCFFASDGSVV